MKPVIAFSFLATFFFANLAAQRTDELLSAAKLEFSKDFYQQDFSKVIDQLTQANRRTPNNPEINYFLANALDRVNYGDVRTLFLKTRSGAEQASSYLEKVNQLTPLYTGSKLNLDPYSKLTSIWGALALAYAYREAPDSARWAFQQGKMRGGFLDPQLEMAANLLNSCKVNAILFSSGENLTYPMLYLQTVDNLRRDVQVIDISLLNTLWYPELLDSTAVNPIISDSLGLSLIPDLVEWQPGMMSTNIKKGDCGEKGVFSWKIDPKPEGSLLVRSEYVLLQTILQNQFTCDIYFTAGFPSDDLLQLDAYLDNGILVSRLNPCKPAQTRPSTDYLSRYVFDKTKAAATVIRNSPDLGLLLQLYAFGYVNAAQECLTIGDVERAKALLSDLEQRFPLVALPEMSTGMNDYLQKLKALIKKVE